MKIIKRFIFILFLLFGFINITNADTGTFSRNFSSGITDCGTWISSNKSVHPDSTVHYGIPNITSYAAGSAGAITCIAHTYVNSSEYAKPSATGFQSANTHLNCGVGERVTKIQYYNGNTLVAVILPGMTSYAGSYNRYRIFCQKYDDRAPNLSDVIFKPGTHLLADDAYNYKLEFSTGPATLAPGETRSNIILVSGKKEASANENMLDYSIKTTGSDNCITKGNKTSCNYIWDIRYVDNFRTTNGGREYTFGISKICDEAGNCWTGNQENKHFVYANTLPANIVKKEITSNNLNSDNNIADGIEKQVGISLKDKYSNAIVPASGINRTIGFNWNSENTMFLNQILRTGEKSVYVKSPDGTNYSNTFFNSGTKSHIISTYKPVGNSYGSGEYKYSFKVYTPTSNQTNSGPVSDVNAKFSLNSFNFDINSTLNNPSGANPKNLGLTNWSQIIAKFNPLYFTKIDGEIEKNGIIEGGTQKSFVSLIRNNSTVPENQVTNRELRLSYGGKDSDYFKMYGGTLAQNAVSTIIDSNDKKIETNPNFPQNTNPIKVNFFTRLEQVKTVKDFSNIWLATHIKYNILNPNGGANLLVTYNSDILGKTSYHGTPLDPLAQQSGIKVDGLTSTESGKDLVEQQFSNDVIVINGNLDKFASKTQIVKNAYEASRNLSADVSNNLSQNYTLTNINNPGANNIKELNNLIYFGSPNGANSKIYNLGNGGDIVLNKDINKTILVIGADLYIKSNIKYTGDSILGIVVLKDLNGKGGNIYIDPNVTNISGTLFAEKSILSFDGTKELDGATEVNKLKNQLYIYGTLFTENTIGGSRENPPKCPYYIVASDCTLLTSQKYDLNYLRRYYINKDGVPANGGKKVTTKAEYEKYPVIVEYNPRVQTTPPPLFSN